MLYELPYIYLTVHNTSYKFSFLSVKRNIYLDDLKRFIREDKVEQAKALFKGSIQRGVISEESFTIWMVSSQFDFPIFGPS